MINKRWTGSLWDLERFWSFSWFWARHIGTFPSTRIEKNILTSFYITCKFRRRKDPPDFHQQLPKAPQARTAFRHFVNPLQISAISIHIPHIPIMRNNDWLSKISTFEYCFIGMIIAWPDRRKYDKNANQSQKKSCEYIWDSHVVQPLFFGKNFTGFCAFQVIGLEY